MKNKILLVVVLILAGGAGFGLQRYFMQPDVLPAKIPQAEFSSVIGTPRPAFALEDMDGVMRDVREFDGKVLLVNFWASWCPPCLKETPLLIEIQNKYAERGVQVLGLAVDEEQAVADFVDTLGINYPVFAGELAAMELARRYGNRVDVLPFTALVDRNGDIVEIISGELEKTATEKTIESLL